MTYIQLNDDNRIVAVVDDVLYTDETYQEFDLPDNFDVENMTGYRVVGGELVFDPVAPAQPGPEIEINRQIAAAIPMVIPMMASTLSDDQVASIPALMPEWSGDGVSYHTGDVARYHGVLYRALQDSMSTNVYPPDISVSLWKAIG